MVESIYREVILDSLGGRKHCLLENFFENFYKPKVESDQEVDENYQQLQRIDFNGMLFNIYLNELMKASATIEGQIPDPALKAESGELLRFLYN